MWRFRFATRAGTCRRRYWSGCFASTSRSLGDDAGEGTAAIGLGLAICTGLVQAHRGRIRAESEGLGAGARFTFTLPVAEGGDAGATAMRLPGASPARRRLPHGVTRRTLSGSNPKHPPLHRAPSLSASAVVVALRFAAHASRSARRYRTRFPKRWKAGPSPLTR